MITLRRLTSADIPACRTLWQARFFDSDAFCDWYFSERFCPELSVGLFENDKLCSMAHGRTMRIHTGHQDEIVSALMIGGVATAHDSEGRGYMKRVMAEMDLVGSEMSAELLILATETPALYRSSGYTVCAKALYVTASGDAPQPLRYDKNAYNINALLDCCNAAGRDRAYFPARTLCAMQSRIDELCCDGAGLLTLDMPDGSIDGYAFCDPNNRRADEVLARSEDAYRKLLSLLPSGTIAMLPPDLPFDGERDSGASLMCKNPKGPYPKENNEQKAIRAFCPETF